MKIVAIPKHLSAGKIKFLNLLGRGLGIRFEQRPPDFNGDVDAWLLDGADQDTLNFIRHSRCPCYAIVKSDKMVPDGSAGVIEFANHPAIPKVVSGKQITPDKSIELKALPEWLLNCTVLASKGQIPIWSVDERWEGGHHFVTFPIPEIEDDGSPAIYLHGTCSLELLPLIIFLKSLVDDMEWVPPPLRACFMFDDPNLHWRTYGYVDFKRILEHASVYRHHVSFATIPLDCWFVHQPTADLFRQNQGKLSVLIHGNDHAYAELARPCTNDERRIILRQSLDRISKLERRCGVKVSRVMAPPHGACSEEFIEEMGTMGFDALCVSYGSLFHYNRGREWLQKIGINSCDIVDGIAILPRFRFSRNCQANIVMAAVLNQPIIPVGHHDDLRDGLESLGEISEYINSLGDVQWGGVGEIAGMQYTKKVERETLRIRLFSRRIQVKVPKGIRKIEVECPWVADISREEMSWRVIGESNEWNPLRHGEIFGVNEAGEVEICRGSRGGQRAWRSEKPRMRLYPVFRRQMTEGRDRLKPMLKRFRKSIFG